MFHAIESIARQMAAVMDKKSFSVWPALLAPPILTPIAGQLVGIC